MKNSVFWDKEQAEHEAAFAFCLLHTGLSAQIHGKSYMCDGSIELA
jgi:hypothetical protein